MCGIAGIISLNKELSNGDIIGKMTRAIAHRGPDGEGAWSSDDLVVRLGHRRLSVLDLSEAGKQPMQYLDRYTITYNGEIYNYIEIREKLTNAGYSFVSDSDTEVLLALYDQKREKCLDDLDGMFAFAIWDSQERILFCARDRFGEKPFYYTFYNGSLFFASEMKALWAAGIAKECNHEMLYYYLEFSSIHHPSDNKVTFYKNIYKLPAANYFFYKPGNTAIEPITYWSLDLSNSTLNIIDSDAVEQFSDLLKTSISRRLRSDVPVGSSLSGGLDSSAIVCLIDELNKKKKLNQNTFSARFPNWGKDEGVFMDAVIKKTNVTPHFTYPDEKGFIDNFNALCLHQEEPFGSSSIYAQYCVMKLAAENNVIVLLDGQGADEMLAGYHYYFKSYFSELNQLGKIDIRRKEMAEYKNMQPSVNLSMMGIKDFVSTNFPNLKNRLIGLQREFDKKVAKKYTKDYLLESSKYKWGNPSFKELGQHLKFDMTDGNLENLLRYCDRNSMAHSREVRLPFLSHELCEFVFRLPSNYKIRNGWTKWIQRKSLEPILPPEITWRKDKIGYEPPQKKWMENPSFKELIIEGKRVLLKEGIITKREFERTPKETTAHSRGDNSWAYLMAAKLF